MTGDAERGWTGAPQRQPSALAGWDVLLPPRWDVLHGSALAEVSSGLMAPCSAMSHRCSEGEQQACV